MRFGEDRYFLRNSVQVFGRIVYSTDVYMGIPQVDL